MGFETLKKFLRCSSVLKIWTISLWDLKHISCFFFQYIFNIWTISLWDLKRETPLEAIEKYKIWTISLWDLKHSFIVEPALHLRNLNYFPMGFETLCPISINKLVIYLNYFPMGFETPSSCWCNVGLNTFELFPYGIWNENMLNDFEPVGEFELFPYGIWNLEILWEIVSDLHLNYFPMGFETGDYCEFSRIYFYLNYFPMGFETIVAGITISSVGIWTISLWDLKLSKDMTHNNWLAFELFPYGIWNLSRLNYINIPSHLNYFPMGFETLWK